MPDPRFDEFTISSLDDFVDSGKDELLLYPSVLLGSISLVRSSIGLILRVSVSAGVRKKRVSRNTISFWHRSVISFAYSLFSEQTVESCGSGHMKLGRLLLPC